ncbi:MAG TPA: sugar ABC transporter permease [Candidatus Enterocloster faecavium]|uniref:Sugar ABC transporter permease n=1 Tax=Candidatus Enterocloster faecavium TaxID=2838560 RepID=A0A9D2RM58_9FIRM|nr:sugar ABC transporter permease [Candidatus Enterocloster faecavium]
MRNRKNRDRNITHFIYVLPNLLMYSLLSIVPIVLGLYYSFTDWNGIGKNYDFVGFHNYIKILKDSRFRKAVLFNVRYAAMLIVCVLLISVILALLLNTRIKGQGFFRAVYFFPACVSMLTIGLIFNYIFFQGLPSIGEALGIEALQKNILSGRKTAIYGILVTNVWKSVAIPTVLVLSALQTIPGEIMEAATVDGANGRQKFFYITLRYILPILSIIFVLVLKEGLMIYDYIMAMTSGGPAGATESITLSIYRIGFEDMKFGYAISQAMIVAVIIAVISIIQIHFTDKKKIYD